MKGRAYKLAISRNYDGYQRALASMVYEFFDKKTGAWISANENSKEKRNLGEI